ncbi:eukaryotic translation initiation factor 2B subunit beta [Oratosquilla oratoria]|uniref:eukaryotic translation initiation factor 2B subunit beta n=1 Tax=Oratosquilla oratoria TaxID=337810 RepID=UPI003F763ABE
MEIQEKFIEDLRQRKFSSEQEKVEQTLSVLESVIIDEKWETASNLLDLIRNISKAVEQSVPWETTPCNLVNKVVKMICDECSTLMRASGNTSAHFSQTHLFTDPANHGSMDYSTPHPLLKTNVLDMLAEYKAEIEQSVELITAQAESKIHSDEVIMTCGYCPTVLSFLKAAACCRKFHVIVAECAPEFSGHKMAKELGDTGVQTTFILDSAIFAVMSRVNKVIIGTRTVLSNGGLKTFVGAAALASAAKFYSVPLYVCSPTYKFSLVTREEGNHYASPDLILPPKTTMPDSVNVAVGRFDYVPPENVTLFITNNGGMAPSYVYRQLSELYYPAIYEM